MKSGEKYQFGDFQVDPLARTLRRRDLVVTLNRRAFDVLVYLLQHSGRVLSRDELLKNVWPDTFVDENSLAQSISALRRALEEKPGDNSYIVTLPGRGYQFVSQVKVLASLASENPALVPDSASVRPDPTAGVLLQRETIRTSITTRAKELPQPPAAGRAWARLSFGILFVLALASYAGWRYFRPQSAPGRIMLAVLPFQNLTGDPDQEYFADGLTEEMITKLGRLHPEQLGVIARTSVMAYKHSNERLDQIGRELSVQYVLEGSYRRAPDHLRITAQLIRVKDQSHLWAEEYDRQPQDILSVQDDVALTVAREIQLRLTPQQHKLLTAHALDPEAHEDYLKGRFFWNERTEDGFRKAIDFFQAAIAKDPNDAEAYAGLADAYLLLGGYGFERQKDTIPKAKQAALRAVQIDDTLAEPYTSLGLIYVGEWNWAEAEKSYKRAIELNPNYSVAHHWYGSGYLAAIPSRTEEMIFELHKAHELDPLSPMITTDLAAYLCFTSHYDEGMKEFQEVLKLDPDFVQAHYLLSIAYELRGMYPEAIAEVQKIKSPDATRFVIGQLGYIYALQGKRREALEVVSELQKLSERTYIDPGYITYIYIALGERDLAFVWLQKAYEEHSPIINGLKVNWRFDSIRSDPRFADLLRRVGIP